MGVHLIVGVWVSESVKRMQTLMDCLDANLKNPQISSAQLVIQQPVEGFMAAVSKPENQGIRWLADRLVHSKVKLVQLGERPTFAKLFELANDEGKGGVVAISSSDVIFDDSLNELDMMDLTKTLICLSPNGGKGGFPPEVSQAAWIFEAPLPSFVCDWTLGLLGSDNKLAWSAWKAGLTVINPCLSVRAEQRPAPSDAPDWPLNPRLDGPYLNVYPVEAASVRRKI